MPSRTTTSPVRITARLAGIQIILIPLFAFTLSASDHSSTVVMSEPGKLQLYGGTQVRGSPGTKPGVTVVCGRVRICGVSRVRNLVKYSHSWKITASFPNTTLRQPAFEVCFHRNSSVSLGMCSPSKWEKNVKGSWTRSMSPFDNKLLDIRMASSSLEALEVSIEEEFFLYRIVLLVFGIVLMTSASLLSKSLVFYYSSAMAIGIILVILLVLFQGMKLLPTGRKNSLGIFIFSSIVGVGSFLLSYLPRLARSVLSEIGISEEMYNPLVIFLVAFVILAGAWLGFWTVRKLVLTEEGSIDTSTSSFVAWSIRIFAAVMILESTMDPLLAAGALVFGTLGLSILSKISRKLLESFRGEGLSSYIPDILPSPDSGYESKRRSRRDSGYDNIRRSRSPLHNQFSKSQNKNFGLASCNSPLQGTAAMQQISDSDTFYSSFHKTPDKRKFSKEEWERLTKDSTKKALEELVSSPDFSKWAVANVDRLTLSRPHTRRRKWLFWF